MHVPWSPPQGSAQRANRSGFDARGGPQRIKPFAGAWAEARVPGAGDAARTARSRRRPAGLCLVFFPSTSQPDRHCSRVLLSLPLASVSPRARSPRPRLAPPPEPGLEAWRCSRRAVKGRGRSAAGWRACSCRRSGRTGRGGKGCVCSGARVDGLVCLLCELSDNIKLTLVV